MTSKKSSPQNVEIYAPAEQVFKAIFESHAAVMLLIEPQTGVLLDANQAAVDFYGYPKSKLCGMFIHEINMLPPEQASAARQKVLSGEQNRIVFPHRLAGGEERIVEVYSSPIVLQGRQALFSIIHDITAHKQVEEELRIRESYLTSIIENQPGLVWLKDSESRFLAVNQAFALSCGEPNPLELVGRTDLDIWPPDLAKKYRSDDVEIMKGGKPRIIVEPIFDKGETKWFETFKTPIFDTQGIVIGTTGYSRDISERKQTEEALRESQSLYHSLVEVSPLSICRKDLEGRFTFANRRFLEVSQIKLEDLIGKTDFDLHPSQLAEKYRSDDQAVLDSGQVQELIEERAVLDGEYAIVQSIKAPIYDGSGKINGIQISFWDITARKRAEENLRESEEKFRTIIELSNEGVALIDERGYILEWNRAQEQISGITQAEAIGSPAWEVQWRQMPKERRTPATAEFLKKSIFQILENGQHISGEVKIETVSGESRTLLQNTFPIKTKRGYRYGIVLHDITERANLEQMKSDFINRASHELRTPLSTAILMADLLEGSNTAEEQQKFVGILKQELNRQRLLLNDLLVAGRIENKRYEVHFAPLNIIPLIEEAISSVKPQADARQITIQLKAKNSLLMADTDHQALLQVLLNLLSNAIKFSRPDGKIVVIAHKMENSVMLAVQDHGIGIPAQDMPHISDRFFRAQNATKLEIQGTGIGLYIIREIMEAIGGHLKLNSVENKGTTVTVFIPIEHGEKP
jgi:PAS domain S-box-containing protein